MQTGLSYEGRFKEPGDPQQSYGLPGWPQQMSSRACCCWVGFRLFRDRERLPQGLSEVIT